MRPAPTSSWRAKRAGGRAPDYHIKPFFILGTQNVESLSIYKNVKSMPEFTRQLHIHVKLNYNHLMLFLLRSLLKKIKFDEIIKLSNILLLMEIQGSPMHREIKTKCMLHNTQKHTHIKRYRKKSRPK